MIVFDYWIIWCCVIWDDVVCIGQYGEQLVLIATKLYDIYVMEDSCRIGHLFCDFILLLGNCIAETSCGLILAMKGYCIEDVTIEDFVMDVSNYHLFSRCVL